MTWEDIPGAPSYKTIPNRLISTFYMASNNVYSIFEIDAYTLWNKLLHMVELNDNDKVLCIMTYY